MTVTCPNCNKEYRIDESRVPPGGAKAKCSQCGHYFRIEHPPGGASVCSPSGRNGSNGESCRSQEAAAGKEERESGRYEHSGSERMEQQGTADRQDSMRPSGSERFTPPPRREYAPPGPAAGFSTTEAIRFGWDATKDNLGFLVGFLIIAAVISWAPDIIRRFTAEDALFLNFILSIISWLLHSLVAMAFIQVSLDLVDNRKPRLEELLSNYPMLLNYIGASVLYGLIVMVGFLLLIVPGIIWGIKFMFCGYFVVDKEDGPVSSLKKSSSITTGQKWNLFLFGLALIGINIIGVLALVVGLLVTIPVSAMASAYVYRRLSS